MDISKTFDADNGFVVNTTDDTGPFFTGGSASPVGLNLPTRTLYIQTNSASKAIIWQKFSTGVNDWRILSAQDVPFDVTGLTTQSPDLSGLTQSREVVGAIANRAFGKSFNQAFTAGNFSTTGSTFQTIQTIPSTSIIAGNYIILMHGRFQKSLISAQLEIRIQVNGSTVLDEEEISLDDDDFFYGHTAVVYVANLSGNITVTSQMRKLSGGGNVQAESRTLMYWRVS